MLVLQDVVWELKQEHVLALLVIPVVHHVKVLRLKPDLAEWHQVSLNVVETRIKKHYMNIWIKYHRVRMGKLVGKFRTVFGKR